MILVINSGSSSIKLKLFDYINNDIVPVLNGTVENIGSRSKIKINYKGEISISNQIISDHSNALHEIFKSIELIKVVKNINDIEVVSFRVVHGGTISSACKLDDFIYEDIEKNIELAPLHNPSALMAIDAIKKILPTANMTVSFDTAFHQSIGEPEYLYPVPKEWFKNYNIRKYGFHGLSCKYITKEMSVINGKEKNNLIICHLGNGASVTCVNQNKSFDTSMGFTPLSGIMMGTRSGDIDPAIIEYICKITNSDVGKVIEELNLNSGLLGMSGLTREVPEIIERYIANDKDSVTAIEKYTQIVADYIIKYSNNLKGKIDGIVFTGGIGENESLVREKIINKIHLLNLQLDLNLNSSEYKEYKIISNNNSAIPLYVIKTNEEKLICEEAIEVLKYKK